MSLKLIRALIATTIVFGPLSVLAEDWDLKSVPPIKIDRVFVSKTDRKFYVLVGDTPSGTFVLMSKDGQVRAPKQGPNSMKYYDGGSLDLNFESGERIMIPSTTHTPTGRAHSLGFNYLKSSSTPRFVTPTTAPQELVEVKPTDKVLRAAGFDSFLTKTEAKAASSQPENASEIIVERLEEFVPVILAFSEKSDYSNEQKLRDSLKQLPESDFRVIQRDGAQTIFGSYESLVVLARESRVAEIRNRPDVQALVASGHLEVEVPMSEMQSPSLSKIDLDSDLEATLKRLQKRSDGTSLAERYQIFRALESRDFSSASSTVKSMVARAITGFLGDVDALHARSEYFIAYQTAIHDHNNGIKEAWVGTPINVQNTDKNPAASVLLQPLRQIGKRGFAMLHSLQLPLANEILIETASAFRNAGFEWFSRKVKGSDKTYFQAYLDNLRQELDLMDELPKSGATREQMAALNLSMSERSGGMFESVPISGKTLSLRKYGENLQTFRLSERVTRNPLVLLGQRGDKSMLKQEIMQFIIDGDKRSYEMAKLLENRERLERARNSSWNREPEVKGHAAVVEFVVGLRWYPTAASATNFSKAEYERAVMEIYTDLLEQSRVVLTNDAVYVALLDSSIEMVKEFERSTGLRNQAHRNVAVAALRLQNEVQKHLLSGWNNLDGMRNALNPSPPAPPSPRKRAVMSCEAAFGAR